MTTTRKAPAPAVKDALQALRNSAELSSAGVFITASRWSDLIALADAALKNAPTAPVVKDTTYQGWTNYETWAVKLWIDNEEGSYNYWRERTREVYDESEADNTFITLTKRDVARRVLSDALKEQHHEEAPIGDANVFTDLLGAALSEVNWREIADSMLDDMEEQERYDAEKA